MYAGRDQMLLSDQRWVLSSAPQGARPRAPMGAHATYSAAFTRIRAAVAALPVAMRSVCSTPCLHD